MTGYWSKKGHVVKNLVQDFLKTLLKDEHRALLEMGIHIYENVSSDTQRKKMVSLIQEILKDGQISESEWEKLGGSDGLNFVKKVS